MIPNNDRMAGREDLLAQHPLTIGEIGRKTRCLSNLSSYSHLGEQGTLRRRAHSFSHLRGKGGLYAPHALTILMLEPRASSLATVRGVHHSSSGYRDDVGIPRVV